MNVFDELPELALTSEEGSELDRYLATPIENPDDVLKWWYDQRTLYPQLSHMVHDYLSIPSVLLFPFLFIPHTYNYFVQLPPLMSNACLVTAT